MARAGRRRASSGLDRRGGAAEGRGWGRPIGTGEFSRLPGEPRKADAAQEERRARLERQAWEAAGAQLRAGTRIRWAVVVAGAAVVVAGIAVLTTMSRPAQPPREAALWSVPLEPAVPLPSSSIPAPSAAPATSATMAATTSATPTPPPTRRSVTPPPPPAAPAPHCPTAETAKLNDDANGIVYNGPWYAAGRRGLGDFHDDVHATRADGSWVSHTFTGIGIALVSETYSDEGRMDIYLDEVFQRTVDTTSQVRHAQQSVFSVCGLSPGRHTIRAVKRSGTYMLLDRFDVTP
ncbi:hypothetical protein [Amycolatopsis sp. NPDC004169]|uniref:hypothetical protein n=1 Tax=Amycolatopsis sp. NPDC004169 TaxID=3154453 RepID=UPI0033A652D8